MLWVYSLLRNGGTAFDIDTNIGYSTLLMAHLVGSKGCVVVFEPFLPVYSLLQENLLLNNLTWAQSECLAVADVAGEARMQSDQTNPLSFVTHLSEKGDLVVSTTSVDKYLESRKLSGLDFIKIDVEGAEDAIIRGMIRTLGSLRPAVLVGIHAKCIMRLHDDPALRQCMSIAARRRAEEFTWESFGERLVKITTMMSALTHLSM
jgi:FkbM family methyltransferase